LRPWASSIVKAMPRAWVIGAGGVTERAARSLRDRKPSQRAYPYCLPLGEQRRRPGLRYFRGSMAGLCNPLPTLRRHPHGGLRTARGRCGSLILHRSGLSPPTPCQSPGPLA
jgi:hypothetical protein